MEFFDTFLDMIGYGKKKPDSSRQLQEAQREQAKGGTAAQEAEARRAGFKNHNEYMVYLRQRAQKSGGSKGESRGQKAVRDATALHPKVLLNHVDEQLKKATKPKG